MSEEKNVEVSYVIPCLNEGETIALCVKECKETLEKNNIEGEIIVADNGSTDDSIPKSIEAGAKVVHISERGYGNALRGGFKEAKGKYICMADGDMSYDFREMPQFLEKLKNENLDMIIGCRFKSGGGKVSKNAMPFMNEYVGNPILTLFGRILFNSHIKDFHCGLRVFKKESVVNLPFTATGMEFASEMIALAHVHKLKLGELPIILRKDERKERKSHLRPIRDALRHIKILISCRIRNGI